jgi:hypothetical protein
LEKRKDLQIAVLKTLKSLERNLTRTFHISKHTPNRLNKIEERKIIESLLQEQRRALNLYITSFRNLQCLHHKATESCSLCHNHVPSYNVDSSVMAQAENPQQKTATMGSSQVQRKAEIREHKHQTHSLLPGKGFTGFQYPPLTRHRNGQTQGFWADVGGMGRDIVHEEQREKAKH